jgi:4-amino-4-deoxy-L-arabinose transferase-like glycosyltransferase
MWNRAGFELYLLAGFYKLFGISPLNFQIVIFLYQSIIGIVMFLLLRKKSFWLATLAYVLYASFTFLVYGTIDESAEILIGLFVFLVFYFYWEFIEKKNIKFLFFAGIATGVSLITKQTSVFILFSTLLLLVIYSRKKLVSESFFYLAGAAIPVFLYAGYFALNNGLYDLYFNTIYAPLFPYRQTAPLWGLSEGMKMLIFHLTVLVPFIFIKTKGIFSTPVKTALIIFILALFPTLLPVFLSYRLISALPIFSVMIAIFLSQGYLSIKKHKNYLMKGIILVGTIAFFVQLGMYLIQNINYIKDNGGFIKQEYRLDVYSENEKSVVQWLKNNTNEKEKIFNISNVLIMFYGNRFPQNKYDGSLIFEYCPINIYYETITENPARVVVFDNSIPTDLKNLKNWKYLQFLKEHYALSKVYGQYEIYMLK